MEKKSRASWRKEPNETGLRSVGQGPRGYELRKDGDWLIKVAPSGGNWMRPLEGWYWYGLDTNTFNTKPLFATAEDALADAKAYYKEYVKQVS